MSTQVPPQADLACSQCGRVFAHSDLVQVAGNWVCGDCCYHDVCAIHDAASRACERLTDIGLCVIAILPWYFALLGCR